MAIVGPSGPSGPSGPNGPRSRGVTVPNPVSATEEYIQYMLHRNDPVPKVNTSKKLKKKGKGPVGVGGMTGDPTKDPRPLTAEELAIQDGTLVNRVGGSVAQTVISSLRKPFAHITSHGADIIHSVADGDLGGTGKALSGVFGYGFTESPLSPGGGLKHPNEPSTYNHPQYAEAYDRQQGAGTYYQQGLDAIDSDHSIPFLNNSVLKKVVGGGGDILFDPATYLIPGSSVMQGAGRKVGIRFLNAAKGAARREMVVAEGAGLIGRAGQVGMDLAGVDLTMLGQDVIQQSILANEIKRQAMYKTFEAQTRSRALQIATNIGTKGKGTVTDADVSYFFPGEQAGLAWRAPMTGPMGRKVGRLFGADIKELKFPVLSKNTTNPIVKAVGAGPRSFGRSKVGNAFGNFFGGQYAPMIRAGFHSGVPDEVYRALATDMGASANRIGETVGMRMGHAAYPEMTKAFSQGAEVSTPPTFAQVARILLRKDFKGLGTAGEDALVGVVESTDNALIDSTKGARSLANFFENAYDAAAAVGIKLGKASSYISRLLKKDVYDDLLREAQMRAEAAVPRSGKGGLETSLDGVARDPRVSIHHSRVTAAMIGLPEDATPGQVRQALTEYFAAKYPDGIFETSLRKIIANYVRQSDQAWGRQRMLDTLLGWGVAAKEEDAAIILEKMHQGNKGGAGRYFVDLLNKSKFPQYKQNKILREFIRLSDEAGRLAEDEAAANASFAAGGAGPTTPNVLSAGTAPFSTGSGSQGSSAVNDLLGGSGGPEYNQRPPIGGRRGSDPLGGDNLGRTSKTHPRGGGGSTPKKAVGRGFENEFTDMFEKATKELGFEDSPFSVDWKMRNAQRRGIDDFLEMQKVKKFTETVQKLFTDRNWSIGTKPTVDVNLPKGYDDLDFSYLSIQKGGFREKWLESRGIKLIKGFEEDVNKIPEIDWLRILRSDDPLTQYHNEMKWFTTEPYDWSMPLADRLRKVYPDMPESEIEASVDLSRRYEDAYNDLAGAKEHALAAETKDQEWLMSGDGPDQRYSGKYAVERFYAADVVHEYGEEQAIDIFKAATNPDERLSFLQDKQWFGDKTFSPVEKATITALDESRWVNFVQTEYEDVDYILAQHVDDFNKAQRGGFKGRFKDETGAARFPQRRRRGGDDPNTSPGGRASRGPTKSGRSLGGNDAEDAQVMGQFAEQQGREESAFIDRFNKITNRRIENTVGKAIYDELGPEKSKVIADAMDSPHLRHETYKKFGSYKQLSLDQQDALHDLLPEEWLKVVSNELEIVNAMRKWRGDTFFGEDPSTIESYLDDVTADWRRWEYEGDQKAGERFRQGAPKRDVPRPPVFPDDGPFMRGDGQGIDSLNRDTRPPDFDGEGPGLGRVQRGIENEGRPQNPARRKTYPPGRAYPEPTNAGARGSGETEAEYIQRVAETAPDNQVLDASGYPIEQTKPVATGPAEAAAAAGARAKDAATDPIIRAVRNRTRNGWARSSEDLVISSERSRFVDTVRDRVTRELRTGKRDTLTPESIQEMWDEVNRLGRVLKGVRSNIEDAPRGNRRLLRRLREARKAVEEDIKWVKKGLHGSVEPTPPTGPAFRTAAQDTTEAALIRAYYVEQPNPLQSYLTDSRSGVSRVDRSGMPSDQTYSSLDPKTGLLGEPKTVTQRKAAAAKYVNDLESYLHTGGLEGQPSKPLIEVVQAEDEKALNKIHDLLGSDYGENGWKILETIRRMRELSRDMKNGVSFPTGQETLRPANWSLGEGLGYRRVMIPRTASDVAEHLRPIPFNQADADAAAAAGKHYLFDAPTGETMQQQVKRLNRELHQLLGSKERVAQLAKAFDFSSTGDWGRLTAQYEETLRTLSTARSNLDRGNDAAGIFLGDPVKKPGNGNLFGTRPSDPHSAASMAESRTSQFTDETLTGQRDEERFARTLDSNESGQFGEDDSAEEMLDEMFKSHSQGETDPNKVSDFENKRQLDNQAAMDKAAADNAERLAFDQDKTLGNDAYRVLDPFNLTDMDNLHTLIEDFRYADLREAAPNIGGLSSEQNRLRGKGNWRGKQKIGRAWNYAERRRNFDKREAKPGGGEYFPVVSKGAKGEPNFRSLTNRETVSLFDGKLPKEWDAANLEDWQLDVIDIAHDYHNLMLEADDVTSPSYWKSAREYQNDTQPPISKFVRSAKEEEQYVAASKTWENRRIETVWIDEKFNVVKGPDDVNAIGQVRQVEQVAWKFNAKARDDYQWQYLTGKPKAGKGPVPMVVTRTEEEKVVHAFVEEQLLAATEPRSAEVLRPFEDASTMVGKAGPRQLNPNVEPAVRTLEQFKQVLTTKMDDIRDRMLDIVAKREARIAAKATDDTVASAVGTKRPDWLTSTSSVDEINKETLTSLRKLQQRYADLEAVRSSSTLEQTWKDVTERLKYRDTSLELPSSTNLDGKNLNFKQTKTLSKEQETRLLETGQAVKDAEKVVENIRQQIAVSTGSKDSLYRRGVKEDLLAAEEKLAAARRAHIRMQESGGMALEDQPQLQIKAEKGFQSDTAVAEAVKLADGDPLVLQDTLDTAKALLADKEKKLDYFMKLKRRGEPVQDLDIRQVEAAIANIKGGIDTTEKALEIVKNPEAAASSKVRPPSIDTGPRTAEGATESIAMKYGMSVGERNANVVSENTLDAMESGVRTSTTRTDQDSMQAINRLRPDDTVRFDGNGGKFLELPVEARYKFKYDGKRVKTMDMDTGVQTNESFDEFIGPWSKREGWTPARGKQFFDEWLAARGKPLDGGGRAVEGRILINGSKDAPATAAASSSARTTVKDGRTIISHEGGTMGKAAVHERLTGRKSMGGDQPYTISGTGTRQLILSKEEMEAALADMVPKLKEALALNPDLRIVAGGAEGFDEALVIAAYRAGVPYHLDLPSPTQGDYFWVKNSQTKLNRGAQYQKILDNAESITYTASSPSRQAMFDRNTVMMQRADEVWAMPRPEQGQPGYNPDFKGGGTVHGMEEARLYTGKDPRIIDYPDVASSKVVATTDTGAVVGRAAHGWRTGKRVTKPVSENNKAQILEISTKSTSPLGRDLSALNLKLDGVKVEDIYQAAKRGPNGELLGKGKNPDHFIIDGVRHEGGDNQAVYDLIYSKALKQYIDANPGAVAELEKYAAYSDQFVKVDAHPNTASQAKSVSDFMAERVAKDVASAGGMKHPETVLSGPDLWPAHTASKDAYGVIPTNVMLRADGTAVMGAGLAKQAADRFPGLEARYGAFLADAKANGTTTTMVDKASRLVLVATKDDWRNPSSIGQVKTALDELSQLDEKLLIPALGTGKGGVPKASVADEMARRGIKPSPMPPKGIDIETGAANIDLLLDMTTLGLHRPVRKLAKAFGEFTQKRAPETVMLGPPTPEMAVDEYNTILSTLDFGVSPRDPSMSDPFAGETALADRRIASLQKAQKNHLRQETQAANKSMAYKAWIKQQLRDPNISAADHQRLTDRLEEINVYRAKAKGKFGRASAQRAERIRRLTEVKDVMDSGKPASDAARDNPIALKAIEIQKTGLIIENAWDRTYPTSDPRQVFQDMMGLSSEQLDQRFSALTAPIVKAAEDFHGGPQFLSQSRKALFGAVDLQQSQRIITHPDIAAVFNSLEKMREPGALTTVLKHYDQFQLWWKGVALSSPGFHARNAMGGIFNNFLANSEPGAVSRFHKQHQKYIKGELSFEDAKKMQVLLQDVGGGQYSHVELGVGGASKFSLNPFSKDFAYLKGNAAVGNKIEFYLRGGLYWDRLEKGLGPNAAHADVVRFHFDYNDLSNFEEKVVKRVMPFYVWSRRNFPLQLEMMMRNPGKYRLYNQTRMSLMDGKDKDSLVHKYITNTMWGSPLPMHIGKEQIFGVPDLPFTRTMSQNMPNFDNFKAKDPKTWLTTLDPYMQQVAAPLRVPLEVLLNRQFFSGRFRSFDDTSKTQGSDLGRLLKPLQDKVGKTRLDYLIGQVVPYAETVRKLVGSEEKFEDRRATSWMAYVGIPLRANSKADQQMEAMRISKEVDSKNVAAMERGPVGPGPNKYGSQGHMPETRSTQKIIDTITAAKDLSMQFDKVGPKSPYGDIGKKAFVAETNAKKILKKKYPKLKEIWKLHEDGSGNGVLKDGTRVKWRAQNDSMTNPGKTIFEPVVKP